MCQMVKKKSLQNFNFRAEDKLSARVALFCVQLKRGKSG